MHEEKGKASSTPSVEVYLPWSNTWRPLPELPCWISDDGRERQVTNTRLFPLVEDGGCSLLLLGGGNYNFTNADEKVTSKVWKLRWNEDTRHYYWTDLWDYRMGKLPTLDMFLNLHNLQETTLTLVQQQLPFQTTSFLHSAPLDHHLMKRMFNKLSKGLQ